MYEMGEKRVGLGFCLIVLTELCKRELTPALTLEVYVLLIVVCFKIGTVWKLSVEVLNQI